MTKKIIITVVCLAAAAVILMMDLSMPNKLAGIGACLVAGFVTASSNNGTSGSDEQDK